MKYRLIFGVKNFWMSFKKERMILVLFIVILLVLNSFQKEITEIGFFELIRIICYIGIGFYLLHFVWIFLLPFFSEKHFMGHVKGLDEQYTFFIELWREQIPNIEQNEIWIRSRFRDFVKKIEEVKSSDESFKEQVKYMKKEEAIIHVHATCWGNSNILFWHEKMKTGHFEDFKKKYFEDFYGTLPEDGKNIVEELFFKIKENQIKLRKATGL